MTAVFSREAAELFDELPHWIASEATAKIDFNGSADARHHPRRIEARLTDNLGPP